MTTTRDWLQYGIECTDRAATEKVAIEHLRPEMAALTADGSLASWWFIRKNPGLRLRCLPTDDRAGTRLEAVLDGLAAVGSVTWWTPSIYEPEIHAFGGSAGMDVAHRLFERDCRGILDHLARRRAAVTRELRAREIGVLLFCVLMRSAELDWFEQGDVWARVAALRPAAGTSPVSERLAEVVRRIMAVDAGVGSRLVDGGPLTALADWIAAFDQAGRQLAELNRGGHLERGLRAVVAHHVIFQWNRLGLSGADQSALSASAKEVVFPRETAPGPATGIRTAADGPSV
jgi:protein-L-isoaspartate(D-aspartate) O-methyltransferase